MGKVFLVDYSNYAHKFYHAFKNISVEINNVVVPTGVLFGFTRFVVSVLSVDTGAEIIFCKDRWDEGRKEDLPEYKEGRVHGNEMYNFDSLLPCLFAPIKQVSFQYSEGKEADDLMACLAFMFKQGFFVSLKDPVVLSGDNDLLQLMERGIPVCREMKKGIPQQVSESYVEDKYGVATDTTQGDAWYFWLMGYIS